MATTPKTASASIVASSSQFWPSNFRRKGVMLCDPLNFRCLHLKLERLYTSCDAGKTPNIQCPIAGDRERMLGPNRVTLRSLAAILKLAVALNPRHLRLDVNWL